MGRISTLFMCICSIHLYAKLGNTKARAEVIGLKAHSPPRLDLEEHTASPQSEIEPPREYCGLFNTPKPDLSQEDIGKRFGL